MKNGTQRRAPGVRVVAIGGGTGLSMLLRGLKHYVARRRQESDRHPIGDLAAIVRPGLDGILIPKVNGIGDIELMTRVYARLGDRLTYIGGLPTAETAAIYS